MDRIQDTYTMDVKDVAKFFGCTPRHIDRLVAERRFTAPLYVGSIKRWRLSDLEAWADKNQQKIGE